MLGTRLVPGWVSKEVEGALLGIDAGGRTRNTGLKRRTVLLMAEGMAQGESRQAVLGREDTCSESTWYGKDKRRKGWGRDGEVVGALEVCLEAALGWRDGETVRALEKARRLLMLEAPVNVGAMVASREGLRELMEGAVEEAVQVRAAMEMAKVAGGMLDRAGEETADKAGGEIRVRFVAPVQEAPPQSPPQGRGEGR